ncbi:MAG: hypothetical protein KAS72_03700 [Phycisphaerales bacterium]|nr:hypothetical protein [Phycisphaerales bacterium]
MLHVLLSIILLLTSASPAPADDAPAVTEPADEQANSPSQEPVAPGEIRTADDLLLALETADNALDDLTAQMMYVKSDALIGEDEVRVGTLHFRSLPVERDDADAPADDVRRLRQFAIHFTTLYVGDRQEADRRDFVFDGQWLLERQHDQRQVFKREVVPPGETFDPLAIGQGPFPIPIGQRRDDILRIYRAELIPPGDEPWEQHTHHLRLHRRADAEDDLHVVRVDLWYTRADLLPYRVDAVDEGDNLTQVTLVNARRNTDLDDSLFDTSTPRDGTWDVEITPWSG